jgi:hypothetical protein
MTYKKLLKYIFWHLDVIILASISI